LQSGASYLEAKTLHEIERIKLHRKSFAKMKLSFEWDADKAKRNLRDHGVSFEEAETVFDDPFLMTYSDPDHSENEERFLSIGISSKARILMVIHTDRGENIRIVSSRKLTKSERQDYEEGDFRKSRFAK
jgi:hypothetical protein